MKDYVELTQQDFKSRVQMCINLLFESEGIEQANIPIEISNKMERMRGYFQYNINRKQKTFSPAKLRFSYKMVNGTYTTNYMDEVILHEVIHYLVFMLGNYEESHGKIFQKYCNKYNCHLLSGSSVGEYSNKNGNIQETKKAANKEAKYTISCVCGYTINKSRSSVITNNINKYRCPFCGGNVKCKQNY